VNRRPESVLTLGIICILIGAILFLQGLLNLSQAGDHLAWVSQKAAETLNYLPLLTLLDGFVILVCGINFLQGANWARWLFTIESVVSCTIFCLAFNQFALLNGCVPYVVFRAICILLLFLPNANEFFSASYRR
jgi:hypothetical protein